MDGKVIMISVDDMLRDFVPLAKGVVEPPDDAFAALDFSDVPNKGPESGMYKPLIDTLNSSGLTPGYAFVATPNKPDPSDKTKQRIDGAMYFYDEAPSETEQTKWSAIELSLECKVEPVQDDPFDDEADDHQPSSDRRKSNLGQLQSYASLVFDKQQRTHHFTLVIFGGMARIVRWDRSGTIVTNKFDYKAEPGILGRFLWRFARLSPEQRGHDLTAIPVLPDSEHYKLMMRRAAEPRTLQDHVVGEDARRLFQASLKGSSTWWQLNIGDRGFLVGAPNFIASGLAGRGTRGYVAIDLNDQEGPFVYLKDCWRVAHDRMEKEGDILEYLNHSKVSNVPTLLCHGDVENQETKTQTVWKKLHPGVEDCPFKTHRHYRMVVREVGLPMSEFRNSRELLVLLGMCILAHYGAYKNGVIHRDISDGNVLIYPVETVGPDGKLKTTRIGLLADWELSKRVDDADAPRQPDRTGTWQFMSVNVLTNLGKKILVEDEMESFFHLILFFALRYLPHNCSDLGDFMNNYFDDFVRLDGEYYCGPTKWSTVHTGIITIGGTRLLKFFRSLPPSPPSAPHSSDSAKGDASANAVVDPSAAQVSDAPLLASGDPTITKKQTADAALQLGESSEDKEKKPPSVPFEEDPRNDHPINGLIKQFLKSLHAYYLLCSATRPSQAPSTTSLHQVVEEEEEDDVQANFFRGHVNSESPMPSSGREPDNTLVTAANKEELQQWAAKLQNHEAILDMFGKYYLDKKLAWPTRDKLNDQVPPFYRPDKECSGLKRPSLNELPSQPPSKRRSVRSTQGPAA